MSYNGKIQLVPLLRVAIACVAGILVGDKLVCHVHAVTWLSLAVLSLLIAGISQCRSDRHIEKTKSGFHFHLRQGWMELTTVALFMASFFIGAACVQHEEMVMNPPLSGHAEEVRGVVVSAVNEKEGRSRCDLLVTCGPFVGHLLRVTVREKILPWQVGDGIAVWTVVRGGQSVFHSSHLAFDYHRWLIVHGYIGTASVRSDGWRVCPQSLEQLSLISRLRVAALTARAALLRQIFPVEAQRLQHTSGSSHLSQEELDEAAVVAAMAMGEKSMLRTSLRDAYSISGVSHVLALSGLHLGILFGLLTLLLGRHPHWWTLPLFLLTIWGFTFLVGCGASVLRSATMLTVYQVMKTFHRQGVSLNVWAFALWMLLLINPLSLWDVGFQLSFMAVLGILTLGYLLCTYERPWRYRFTLTRKEKNIRSLLAFLYVSFSAQLATAPLVMYYFHRFSCYFFLTNLLVIPLTTILLYLIVAALLLFPLRGVLLTLTTGCAHMMNLFVSGVAALPGASIEGISINEVQLVAIYVVMILICHLFFVLLHPGLCKDIL